MEPFEVFEHAGFSCELHTDEEPWSPAEWDQLGSMVWLRDELAGGRAASWDEREAVDRGGSALLVRYLRMARGMVAVPFTFQDYGSSGARLWATDETDDNPSGFIFTTAARAAELGVAVDDIPRQLAGEIHDWGSWVAGEVVGFVVRDSAGEVVESCWGFYPDDRGDGLEYVRGEARAAAETAADDVVEELKARAFWAAREVPTIG